MKTKFLVTGGAGFIGCNLAYFLKKRGVEFVVVDNLCAGKSEHLPTDTEFYQLDVRDTCTLTSLLYEVDTVVHLAALPSVPYSIEQPTETHDNNVNGLVSVLDAARQAGVRRVVFASSSAVYGDQEVVPAGEDLLPSPGTPYALHKLIGEQYLRLYSQLYDLETVSLRFFNVYGPGMNPNGAYAAAVGRFLQQAKRGESLTIVGDGQQTRDFVHVSDVCGAILLAAYQDSVGKGEVFNIGSGKQITVQSLAELIGSEFIYTPARQEVRHSCADIQKASDLLDWRPEINFKEAIKELQKTF